MSPSASRARPQPPPATAHPTVRSEWSPTASGSSWANTDRYTPLHFVPPGTAGRGEVAYRPEGRSARVRDCHSPVGHAPRPDPETPAPVRFLPAFDNAILGYDDRSRIIDDGHRGLSVAGERVVLVDGRVAATWTVESGTVTVSPLRGFSAADRAAVTEQGQALASFLSDNESDRVRVESSPR
ncbi:winged helix DNA-binding domain-containing protein [Micromonospora sp. D93]|uniref:DNA glycosylase AlkZ-like family protein n=1 Tax=Micromonospora sp. D93 TaxID=2824886 RepID=UPI001B36DC95|nr:crosslink repair DNA glycosylase YcaQ family protein [Micromonospora sp. D93]MBQ1016742.1 winged helix DNA-binding domain-containing protein [Micromonospora sp. D93]